MTDAVVSAPAFSHVEQILLRRLRARRGGDVAIRALFCAAFGVASRDVPESRVMQQRLGPRITSLNRKLRADGEQVVPGRLKRTYRLAPLESAAAAE